MLARSLHTSCTDIFPCGASSVATSARPRLIACCTTLAYVVSHRPSVTTSPPTPLLDLPLLSQEMGCAGSTAQGSSTSGPGTPGTKQNQASESEKDEAAATIQGFAATYNTQKKKEKEQDAAAAEIQMQAAAFLKQKQAAAARKRSRKRRGEETKTHAATSPSTASRSGSRRSRRCSYAVVAPSVRWRRGTRCSACCRTRYRTHWRISAGC